MGAALTDLDAQIYEAHNHNARLFSIFFDMENAFLRVWHFLICKSLYQKGLRGHPPQLIQNYLKNRLFKVRVSNALLSSQRQHNGIPQGSPLSGTLFLLAIDDIVKQIPSSLQSLLFVDDLSIHLRSSNPQRAYRILQEAIPSILSWLSAHGFRISALQTKFIISIKPHSKKPINFPKLRVGHTEISPSSLSLIHISEPTRPY